MKSKWEKKCAYLSFFQIFIQNIRTPCVKLFSNRIMDLGWWMVCS